ncbi:hypothetical protein GCM10027451_05400 [Geodermatophilus aquaeductus]|uniref:Cupredoxin-like domain-containing protein n=1 Tax=Geodermatophilus aquaeductus TaxID=1564161 RepID=A0A521C4C6_9ACTN|nr:hypothetical protein [Geodermatophilus aquaeductus]SMO54249.1 hypothetical protein SAMN06273567_102135 [Geodermatophilus aquaeductus]
MSRRLPVAFAAAATALVVLTGCAGTAPSDAGAPSSSAPSTTPGTTAAAAPSTAAGRVLEVRVSGGQVTGDTGRVPVALGEEVTLTVTSDVADEVHVHGYAREAALAPGTPATVRFPADIPGVFEVELHETGTVLLSLQVG